jgi:hypothetical protein
MQFDQLRRREFISLLGGTAAWPLAARAQQAAMPVIGCLSAGSLGPSTPTLAVIRQSLAEAGYVEGRNMAIDCRFAEGQYDRLPALAEELVRRRGDDDRPEGLQDRTDDGMMRNGWTGNRENPLLGHALSRARV